MKYQNFSWAVLGIIFLGGCNGGSKGGGEQTDFAVPPGVEESVRVHVRQLENRLNSTEEQLKDTQTRLVAEQEARSRWQLFTVIAVGASIALLVLGVAIGSNAKEETVKEADTNEPK